MDGTGIVFAAPDQVVVLIGARACRLGDIRGKLIELIAYATEHEDAVLGIQLARFDQFLCRTVIDQTGLGCRWVMASAGISSLVMVSGSSMLRAE